MLRNVITLELPLGYDRLGILLLNFKGRLSNGKVIASVRAVQDVCSPGQVPDLGKELTHMSGICYKTFDFIFVGLKTMINLYSLLYETYLHHCVML